MTYRGQRIRMVLDFSKATYTARNSVVSPTKNIVKLDQKIKTRVIIDKKPLKQLKTKKNGQRYTRQTDILGRYTRQTAGLAVLITCQTKKL